MADFRSVTASNACPLTDAGAVRDVLDRYLVDPAINLEVAPDPAGGPPCLTIDGPGWPEAWPVPPGEDPEAFDPYTEELYPQGAAGWLKLLHELAPFLAEPLTVQAIGSCHDDFPLSACQWRVLPGNPRVRIAGFHHGYEQLAAGPRPGAVETTCAVPW